jgi:hypothetical protein
MQTSERPLPTHHRERAQPVNSQQRVAMRQQMKEAQKAHRSALQSMQPRICRQDLRRAGKDFAARACRVNSADTAKNPAQNRSESGCKRSPGSQHEAFVIPMTPRGQHTCTDASDAEEQGQMRGHGGVCGSLLTKIVMILHWRITLMGKPPLPTLSAVLQDTAMCQVQQQGVRIILLLLEGSRSRGRMRNCVQVAAFPGILLWRYMCQC